MAGQLQIGLWLITWHFAPIPQILGHGFRHFWLEQASLRLQSELIVHSGLHNGGEPMNPEMHEHAATPLTCLHWLFGPQGDGTHGLVTSTDAEIKYIIYT